MIFSGSITDVIRIAGEVSKPMEYLVSKTIAYSGVQSWYFQASSQMWLGLQGKLANQWNTSSLKQ